MVADVEVDKVPDMEVDKVADMEVDMVAFYEPKFFQAKTFATQTCLRIF